MTMRRAFTPRRGILKSPGTPNRSEERIWPNIPLETYPSENYVIDDEKLREIVKQVLIARKKRIQQPGELSFYLRIAKLLYLNDLRSGKDDLDDLKNRLTQILEASRKWDKRKRESNIDKLIGLELLNRRGKRKEIEDDQIDEDRRQRSIRLVKLFEESLLPVVIPRDYQVQPLPFDFSTSRNPQALVKDSSNIQQSEPVQIETRVNSPTRDLSVLFNSAPSVPQPGLSVLVHSNPLSPPSLNDEASKKKASPKQKSKKH